MALPYITIGSPTTGGGKVITANAGFLIEGKAVACVGDKATCPKHKTVATIVAGDNHMLMMGKAIAQHNSALSCGCRCIANQSLTVGNN
ncbi:PAAR domain-containing protein [Acinetobacter soli]|uniref:PAAR domain-containing protein n=1 Tax=Acinetobacter soli TaxID=487316 RepID=UPI000E6AD5C9|nr:PAAR domain-containing protein [Acinetobacter soli]